VKVQPQWVVTPGKQTNTHVIGVLRKRIPRAQKIWAKVSV